MDTFAPILGMTMMALGLILLLFSFGLLLWYFWPQLARASGRGGAGSEAAPNNQSGDTGP